MNVDRATEKALSILARAGSEAPPFPPAELYSEGWMLRLIMETHIGGGGGLPVPYDPSAGWYSEARLASPFQPSRRGDPRGEGITHADGVIGHFAIRDQTTAGFALNSATQFVTIEAKMNSKLAPGTTRVPWYDQAVRNVAAMAWAIRQAGQSVASFDSLAFIVAAPEQRLVGEPSFSSYTDKSSLIDKVARRIELYRDDDPKRHVELLQFVAEVYEPMLERLDVWLWSWEEAIGAVSDGTGDSLGEFYANCLLYNGVGRT